MPRFSDIPTVYKVAAVLVCGGLLASCWMLGDQMKPSSSQHRVAGKIDTDHKLVLRVYPKLEKGIKTLDVDGIPRPYTTDVDWVEPFKNTYKKYADNVLPKCYAEDLNFTVNGVKVSSVDLLFVITHPQRVKPGDILTVKATGQCGAFKGDTTTVFLRANTSDPFVYRDVFLRHSFFFIDRYLNPEAVHRIVDLGTNVGLSLVYWASHFPNAKILGVEPELHNFGMATLNAGHRGNVFIERAAVTNKMGWSNLMSMQEGDWAWAAEPTLQLTTPDSFKSVTIPHLLDKYGWDTVDLLKIDIEGGEIPLCDEIHEGADWIKKVRCVSFEYHDHLFPDITETQPRIQEQCSRAMEKAGFRFMGHYRVDDLFFWCR